MRTVDLQKVLWDVDMNRLHEVPTSFIVRRVLAHGGVRLMFQMIHEYGIDVVRHEFARMKEGAMQPRRYRYIKEFILA